MSRNHFPPRRFKPSFDRKTVDALQVRRSNVKAKPTIVVYKRRLRILRDMAGNVIGYILRDKQRTLFGNYAAITE